jgi:hypothetical protein
MIDPGCVLLIFLRNILTIKTEAIIIIENTPVTINDVLKRKFFVFASDSSIISIG